MYGRLAQARSKPCVVRMVVWTKASVRGVLAVVRGRRGSRRIARLEREGCMVVLRDRRDG